jgi:hypothetical protein
MADHLVATALLPDDVREHQRGLGGRLALTHRQQTGARFAQLRGALVGLPIQSPAAPQ